MNNAELTRRARQFMRDQGLANWGFVINPRMRRVLGRCKYASRIIEVSQIRAKDEDCWDTVIHEVAHALTEGNGHGHQWKAKCRELGLENPTRTNRSENARKAYRYIGRRNYACTACDVYIHDRRIIWTDTKTGQVLPNEELTLR